MGFFAALHSSPPTTLRPLLTDSALVGIVPARACDESGPINLGELLVPASIPGDVRCRDPETDRGCPIAGEALATLEVGTGRIPILMMRQRQILEIGSRDTRGIGKCLR